MTEDYRRGGGLGAARSAVLAEPVGGLRPDDAAHRGGAAGARSDHLLVALNRDGGIQGRGSTFGAAVGLVVDAALEARTEP